MTCYYRCDECGESNLNGDGIQESVTIVVSTTDGPVDHRKWGHLCNQCFNKLTKIVDDPLRKSEVCVGSEVSP